MLTRPGVLTSMEPSKMKTRTIILALIHIAVLLFSGCSKSENVDMKDQKLYPITFNVTTGFKQEILPMASATIKNNSTRISNQQALNRKTLASTLTNESSPSTLSQSIVTIEYVIYNASDLTNRVKWSVQHNTDPSFGNIKEELPAGNYTITMVALSSHDYYFDSWDGYQNMFVSPNGADLFSKSLNFTVGDVKEPIDINLDRRVAKLDVNITDSIPKNISLITIGAITSRDVWLNKDVLNINPGTILTSISHYIDEQEAGKSNLVLSKYINPNANGQVTSDVNITAYNSTGIVIINKSIKGVKFEKNKKTILTGALFTNADNSPLSNFSIQVNNAWDHENIEVSF
jgi:hypothetical protein